MQTTNKILIGVDGSSESDAAVVWGVREAARRGASVKVVNVCESVVHFGRLTSPIGPVEEENEFGRPIVDKAIADAEKVDPSVVASGSVLHGSPTRVLLDLSAEVDLVVIGTRGLGTISHLLLGSVSNRLLAHADCPVVVVGGTDEQPVPVTGRVVVAVGDSPHNDAAVRFAYREAQLHDVPLEAIRVYRVPNFPVPGGPSLPVHPTEGSKAEAELLTAALVRCGAGFPEVTVTSDVYAGVPSEIFEKVCAPADLLVLGHRRHHRFVPPALGPMDASILQTAKCPVVIVSEPLTVPELDQDLTPITAAETV